MGRGQGRWILLFVENHTAGDTASDKVIIMVGHMIAPRFVEQHNGSPRVENYTVVIPVTREARHCSRSVSAVRQNNFWQGVT